MRSLLVLLLVPAAAAAGDWPKFLGPTGDNASAETGIVTAWPAGGLKKLWECKLGAGYAPPIVAAGKLYHFDRFGDNNRLTCRDAATGAEAWVVEYPTAYEDLYGYDPGPRCGPVTDGERVYTYGPEGVLHAVTVAGKIAWKFDTKAKYHFHQNFFGVGSGPFVEGETLILAVGGSARGPRPIDLREAKPNGTAVVGLDRKTGDIKYEAGDDLASYSSPTVATIAGKRLGLYFARGGLLGFDPATGETRFRQLWRAKSLESVNVANPVVVGDKVFLSECYERGSVLLDLAAGKPAEVWSDRDKDRGEKSLAAHWNTPIHHAGFVYGSTGRHTPEGDLRCVELATGAVKWAKKNTTRCTLLKVDGHFLSLGEAGELRLFKIDAGKYDEAARWESPDLDFPAWAPPVLANGKLYLRGKDKLVCYELIPGK